MFYKVLYVWHSKWFGDLLPVQYFSSLGVEELNWNREEKDCFNDCSAFGSSIDLL